MLRIGPMIIGVSGKIGSGKDELAECIKELDPEFQVKKYADKLKQVAALLTGLQDQYSREAKDKYLDSWGMTVREIQQRIGTEAMRDGLHPDTWILALFADYKPGDKWIITDVRFHNETAAIIQRGGFLVRIDGTRNPQQGHEATHISETSLDDYPGFHYRFNNSLLYRMQLLVHARWILNDARRAYNKWNQSQAV